MNNSTPGRDNKCYEEYILTFVLRFRALPTPPGRPQSMPAGIPNSSNAFVRGRHRPTLSQAPPSPSLGGVTGVASLPPASLGPTPQPPALGEDFARNEGSCP